MTGKRGSEERRRMWRKERKEERGEEAEKSERTVKRGGEGLKRK